MKNILYAAICGDVIGSIYEGKSKNAENENFDLFEFSNKFTDDTVLTIAVADCILHGDINDNREYLRKWARKYPYAGYGKTFREWFQAEEMPNEKVDSWGNGSAMRVSAVGWVSSSLDETLELAKKSAEWTHSHEDAIKGAQATAACIWLARNGRTKAEIKKYIEEHFGYDLSKTAKELRDGFTHFSSKCADTVPFAIMAFLESDSYESAIRKSVFINNDTDTTAAICGSFTAPFYGEIPEFIVNVVKERLPKEMLDIIEEFDEKYRS